MCVVGLILSVHSKQYDGNCITNGMKIVYLYIWFCQCTCNYMWIVVLLVWFYQWVCHRVIVIILRMGWGLLCYQFDSVGEVDDDDDDVSHVCAIGVVQL